jgi:hypothetical protein
VQLAYEQAVTLYNQALELLGEREDPRRRPLVLKRALSYQALMHMVFDTGQERESRPHMVPA